MQLYQWLCLFGIPTIIGGSIAAVVKGWLEKQKQQAKKEEEEFKAIKLGIQAILRDRLIQGYHYYEDKGWADYEDRNSLENVYIQYEALGENGVMEDLHKKFLQLPTHKPQ